MATLREQSAKFENKIAGFPEAERNAARAEFERIQAQRRQARVGAIAAKEKEAQSGSFGRRAAGAVGAAGLNAVNTATFGGLPRIAGAIAGPESQEKLELGLEAAQQVNPVASGVGSLAGFFGPGAGQLLRGAGKLATRATGTARLAERTAGSGFAAKAGAQVLQNYTGGAGAITANELARSAFDDRSIGLVLSDINNTIKSPLNVGSSAGMGAVTAKFTRTVDKELRRAISTFERRTGQEVPLDVLTNSAEAQRFMDTMARTPGVQTAVQRVRERLFGGLHQMVRDMAKARNIGTSREAARGAGARGARELAGTGRQPGRVTEARRGPESLALAAEGSNVMSQQSQANLVSGLAGIMRGNRGREPRAGFTPIIKEFLRLATTKTKAGRASKPLTVDELEGLRKQTSRLAFAGKGIDPLDPRLSERSRVEARDFYHLLNEAIESAAPRYAKALHAGEKLRRLEEALPVEKVAQLDDATMAGFWQGKGAVQRLRAAEEHLDPADLQSAKGWLFHRLIEKVVNPDTGLVNIHKLDTLTGSPGMFNSQIFDRALPGVLRELRALALLSQRMQKGIAAAEGSKTAGRGAQLAAIATGATGAAGLVAALVTNGWSIIPTALGGAGLAALVRLTLRSAVDGKIQGGLNALARGAPAPLTRAAPALQQAAGGTPLGALGQAPQ